MDNRNDNTAHDEQESTKENDSIKKELESCKEEYDVLKSSYMRLMADFENAQKHMAKERARCFMQAQSDLILQLLPVIDNFDRAFAEKEKEEISPELEPWFKGFILIKKQFDSMLNALGIQEIETKEFDPEFHEAVYSVEKDDAESGSIVDVIQKGYAFKDHVIRPAKVSVAK